MKQLHVRVTRKHIENGCVLSQSFCPIALAVREKGYKRVTVNGSEIKTGRTGHGGKTYKLPPIAEKFVRLFDYGSPVKPITFKANVQKAY